MGIINISSEVSKNTVMCGETFSVATALMAAPKISEAPADIVLLLDTSSSMRGNPIKDLKTGASRFVDVIAETTKSGTPSRIGNGSRIGIVAFESLAEILNPLTDSVSDLKNTISGLDAKNGTNHEDGFTKAISLFEKASTNRKIILLFTDGVTTIGASPTPLTDQAKADGITIYSVALTADEGQILPVIKTWVSEPAEDFVVNTPTSAKLEELFVKIAGRISIPGATGISVVQTFDPCFSVVGTNPPSKGKVVVLDKNRVTWSVPELGATQSETVYMNVLLKSSDTCSGKIPVIADNKYSDLEGNTAPLLSPEIEVDCGGEVIIADKHPAPIPVTIDGCTDSLEYNAGDIYLDALGRVLQLDVVLKNVCPDKRVALAAVVTELDAEGNEYNRGLKTYLIPAHTKGSCTDVAIRCINFVLPEITDETGNADSICNQRKFNVRFIAHYVDTDFIPCR